MDGWPWSTTAHATDVVERQVTVEYAGRGLTYDSEGTNRNVNVGIPTLAGRLAANPVTPDDPNVLPGTTDTAAPDAPDGEQGAGFLWNGALKAGLTIRNYGFFIDIFGLIAHSSSSATARTQSKCRFNPARSWRRELAVGSKWPQRGTESIRDSVPISLI